MIDKLLLSALLIAGVVQVVNIFLLIKLDANNRGMNNPLIWALVMAGNSSGLFIYLLLREPGILELDELSKNKYKKYKKAAKISLLVLIFLAIIILYRELFI